jgi:Sec-independent protein translocase protein TatA
MFGLSLFEIIFLLGMALIVIGPKQLPEVARTLGKFLTELRRSTNVITEQMKQSITEEPPLAPPKSVADDSSIVPPVDDAKKEDHHNG